MGTATRRQALGLALAGSAVLVASLSLSPAGVLRALEGLAARPAAFAVALLAVYLLRPLFVWPISAVSVAVGYVYGVGVGFPVALAGAVFTCVLPFALARYASTDAGVLGRLGRSGARYFDAAGSVRGVFAARLMPLPADAVSYGAGVSGVPGGAFLLGTLLGEIPWVGAAVLAGSSMRRLSVDGGGTTLTLLALTGAVAVLALAGPAYRHLWGDLDREPAGQ